MIRLPKPFSSVRDQAFGFTLVLLLAVVVRAQDSGVSSSQLAFEGNKVFSEKELLDVANKCLAGMAHSGEKYQLDQVEICLRRVRSFLQARGYLRATVGPLPTLTEDSARFVIPVAEGVRYRMGEIRLIGSTVFSSAQLLEMSTVKPGDIANGDALGVWLFERVQKAYANLGYLEYTVDPAPNYRPTPAGAAEGVVDLTIDIEEGKVFVVRSIEFKGNGKIPSTILQRELLIKAGDVFSRERFEESVRKVNELNLFDKVHPDKDVDYRSNRKSRELDITIRVKETKTNL